MKLLLLFFNTLLSITYANYESDSLEELNLERRSSPKESGSGLYKIMFKPYVLELLNSKTMSRLKKTACWDNMHFLLTNRNLHYLASLPISRALFTSRIPQFQEWLLNLRKGPSAAKGTFIKFIQVVWLYARSDFSIQISTNEYFKCFKGIIKKMYQVPAMRRVLADPNNQKLFSCPCWSNGTVQSIRPSFNHISWFLSRSSRSSSDRCLD